MRFFLYHKGIVKKYIGDKKRHLFVPVDLNDLVERKLFPFWILTFKRIVDGVEQTSVDLKTKKEIALLFLDSIQSRNLFLTIENIRKALVQIVENGFLPTIFFIRFDRLIEIVNGQFFANLEGLIDVTNQRLSYVFTSFRTIDRIAQSLPSNFLQVFANVIYLRPATQSDTQVIFKTFKRRYKISAKREIAKKIVELSGGHVQYLHLATVIFSQVQNRKLEVSDLMGILLGDERISFQGEEIWESLTDGEQATLSKIHQKSKVSSKEREENKYLWDTGLVFEKDGKLAIFSPLFEDYLDRVGRKEADKRLDLTKKEHLLFSLMVESYEHILEREKIISYVWPEEEEFGVSDWTIDRLVARLRAKLLAQKSEYQLVTVKTRGFKLTKKKVL